MKTTIAIEKTTVQKLVEIGHKNQTYDQIIQNLLKNGMKN